MCAARSVKVSFAIKAISKGILYLLSEVAFDCTGSAQQGSMTGVEY